MQGEDVYRHPIDETELIKKLADFVNECTIYKKYVRIHTYKNGVKIYWYKEDDDYKIIATQYGKKIELTHYGKKLIENM